MANNSMLSSVGTYSEHNSSTDHAVRCLKKIESFFLNEQLTDVVLIAGTRRIPAHRLLLSAASDYFAAMFSNYFKEASQNEIQLPNIDEDALWALINYCYTGKVEIVTENVKTLLETANILQMKEAVETCCRFLEKQLNPSNCIGIKRFADSLGCHLLREVSQQYTNDHFVEIIENEEFLNLSVNELTELLGSDELKVSSEEDVFRGLQSWIKHDVENRKGHVSELVKLIRFPLLSPSFIIDHIKTNPIFRDSTNCLELIIEAFGYRLLPERRSMLQSPKTHSRKNLVPVLYVLGGYDCYSSSVERYDAKLNKWTVDDGFKLRAPPGGAMAVSDGKLYMVAGLKGNCLQKTVQCYDLKRKTLRGLPPLSTRRNFVRGAVLGGFLYIVGGRDSSGYLDTVDRLDLEKETWSSVPPISSKRSEIGVAVLDGKLYAVGGYAGFGFGSLSTVECYDPDTNQWTICASMHSVKGTPGVGVLNGFLYAVGSYDDSTGSSNAVERYDPRTDTWNRVASMKHARYAAGVAVMDGKLFAVGGTRDPVIGMNAVEVYDPIKDEWQELAPLTVRRDCPFAMVIK